MTEAKNLKEKDKINLENFIALLEAGKMRAELRGSASVGNPNYKDLDLNVWDAEEEGPGYRLGRKAMDNLLKSVGAKKIKFSIPFAATWCEGRWQFDFLGTEFDVMYTPGGNRLAHYR